MMDRAAGLDRRRGFEDALREAGIPLRPGQACVAAFNMESGYEQARTLLSREPGLDCLFCATDTIAIGALQYCRSQGIRVPDDLMLAAVGDSLAGRVAYVPLTSVQLHYRTAGRLAAGMLLDPPRRLRQPGAGLRPAAPRLHRRQRRGRRLLH